jgi:CDP-glucose 4,6-dehydratase
MEGMVDSVFWRGKRVFLTGHTGFKGGWIATWLHGMGAHVTGFSLPPPTNPSFCEACGVLKFVETTLGDIRDRGSIADALKRAEPDVVFHMAAQSLVRASYADPVGTYATNVMGTVHLLDVLRERPSVRAMIVITSDKCYENREWMWGYRENEPMGGYDPYSSSKGCAELVTAAYRNSFFGGQAGAVASARAGNVIGGGDWAEDRLIPDFIRAMTAGRELLVRFPHAIRPWQHVLEPLSGYLVLAQRLFQEGAAFAEGWNFGPSDNDARPVSYLVERLVDLWGDGARSRVDEGAHPHEAQYLKLDTSKARGRLHWRQKWELDTALEKLVDWYKGYLGGKNMLQLSADQIETYIKLGV